ncbi:MAG TPA: tRNA (adenosine(37)-N6)-threonylcarbamoyltransferase complex dimerization subunit type 1 TsaB [Trueperaceae bacterium]
MSDTWLGIDTSTSYLCLALWSPEGGLLAESVERVDRRHAVRFVATLEGVLERAGRSRRELTAIAAGGGPGSYTGLRVGGAAAKGLASALGVPLAGVDTLAAMAFRGLDEGEEGVVAIDARRGNAYLGRYRRHGDEVFTLEAPHKAPLLETRSRHRGIRFLLDVPPDPGYVARQANSGVPYRPLYL